MADDRHVLVYTNCTVLIVHFTINLSFTRTLSLSNNLRIKKEYGLYQFHELLWMGL